jgi:AraC family transcriptional regulator of adaptative response/methylated-DNA-[protein]-cysteine methyltransferase
MIIFAIYFYDFDKVTVVNIDEVRGRMITRLPDEPWADVEIVEWTAEDDTLPVEYSFADSAFGRVLVANTAKGVCYLAPADDPEAVFADFGTRFPRSVRVQRQTTLQNQAVAFLGGEQGDSLRLHLRGTAFQTGVWQRLTRIPSGLVVSYSTLAGDARYARAVGTAVGRNPVFGIVPCHRVVNSSGAFDRFFWGTELKTRLLEREFAENR